MNLLLLLGLRPARVRRRHTRLKFLDLYLRSIQPK